MDKELYRRCEVNYAPSKRWVRSRNPETKEEIIAWYKRERAALEARRFRSVTRKFEATEIYLDRETRKIVKTGSCPEMHQLNCWKLTEQDYRVYLGMLERQFEKRKAEWKRKQLLLKSQSELTTAER